MLQKIISNGSFELKICSPIELFLARFDLAHSNPMSGQRDDANTLNNISRLFWPLMYKWVTMLIHDCLDCQRNKSKTRFKRITLTSMGRIRNTAFPHIVYNGPSRSSSNKEPYCLVVLDSFSRYVQVNAVKSANSDESKTNGEIHN